MIHTIILDLDGPLLDGILRHYNCYSRILIENGFEPAPIDRYWMMKRSRTDRRTLLEYSRAASMYQKFLETWMQRIETREYLMFDRLQPDALAILERWKTAGLRLLLATMRNCRENLLWQLGELNLKPAFDDIVVVGSERGGLNKAAEIRSKLGEVASSEMLWIGDTEVDIAAAHELHVPVCALSCGLRTREYLATLAPDYMETDLRSIADKLANAHSFLVV